MIILIWEGVCYWKVVDSFLFPSPWMIVNTAYKMLRTGELQEHIFITLKRFISGFIVGCVLGFSIGYGCGLSKKINNILEPLLYFLYPIPRFALLPFIILIFGTGNFSKIIFVAAATFFPIAINTMRGINSINSNFLEVAKHYGAKGWKLFKRVILPGSLPSVFTGVRISSGIALTFVVVVEFLTTTNGIGAMMWVSLQTLRIDKLFLGVLIIALLNVILNSMVTNIERSLIPWGKEEYEVYP